MAENPTRARGRWTLLALLGITLAPVLGAYLWWTFPELRPAGRTNHGDLIEPTRQLRNVALQGPDGGSIALEDLKGRWTLVYFGRGPCDPACRSNLYNMRQLRIALGKNAGRLQNLYVTGDAAAPEMDAVMREYPELLIATGSRARLDALTEQFAIGADGPLQGAQRLYLVDPLGNLMMMFPEGLDAADILKDLKRLMRVSQIG